MSNPGRWDRSFIKRMPKAQRQEVERLLVKGVTGKSITKKLGLPLNTWVSAVKKNPIPGGVLDPKGKVAKFEGDWVDFDGVVREYKGLDAKGQPKPGLPIIKRRGRRPNAQTQKAEVQEVKTAARDSKGVLPFSAKRARLDSAKQASGNDNDNDPAGTPISEGGVPDAPPAMPMPNAQHEGSKERDTEAPIPDEPKRRSAHKGRVAKLAETKYPIKKRMDDLLTIKAAALKDGEHKLALDVIKTFNDMDGTSTAAKRDDQGPPSNAPLFAMPKGISSQVAVGVSPVGPVPLRLDDDEVIVESETTSPMSGDAVEPPADASTITED